MGTFQSQHRDSSTCLYPQALSWVPSYPATAGLSLPYCGSAVSPVPMPALLYLVVGFCCSSEAHLVEWLGSAGYSWMGMQGGIAGDMGSPSVWGGWLSSSTTASLSPGSE